MTHPRIAAPIQFANAMAEALIANRRITWVEFERIGDGSRVLMRVRTRSGTWRFVPLKNARHRVVFERAALRDGLPVYPLL